MTVEKVLNAYDCPACGKPTVTIDSDEGVTPMFLGCRATAGCKELAVSRMYDNCDGLKPEWEWYRPTPKEAQLMSLDMQQHLSYGGLALRRIV